jgi:two-component system response regulator HydG
MTDHHILVVDDNKDFADVFCDVLKANDYNAECCYNGEKAVKMVREGKFDIMFLDIRMPDMNGVQVLKEIKKIQPDSTVIMMTGYSVDEMVEKAVEEKASDIIYKPFEIEKVLGLLKK